MAKRDHLYLGKAGQHAAMSEFIARGWNAAIPEVDVGDDILVVRDDTGTFSRVQVKTATATKRSYGHSARFKVPLAQLKQPVTPKLTYIFVIRYEQQWTEFIVIDRSDLWQSYRRNNLGSVAGDSVLLTFQIEPTKVICSGVDFSNYLNDFSDWPVLSH